MRPRVSDTITGVAIAVALVPPPVAAGIALGEGFRTQARGALLLYGTNLGAIVFGTVATVLALRLLGERPFELSRRRVTKAATIVVVLGLALGVPLAGSFTDAVGVAQSERDRRVRDGEVTLVSVVLLGRNDSYIPALAALDDGVADVLGRPVELGIRLVGVADQVASGGSRGRRRPRAD